MPVASTSRKKLTRRRAASSEIEEDNAANEDDNNEMRAKGETVKKGKHARKEKQREEDHSDGQDNAETGVYDINEGDGGDDGDENHIDVENFTDQPLTRAELQKLNGLVLDWQMVNKKMQQSWSGVRSAAVAIASAGEDGEGEETLEEIDLLMRELIDISVEMAVHEKALHDIYQGVARGDSISDAMTRYQSGYEQEIKRYTEKTARQKYAKREEYTKFKEDIYEMLHPGTPIPPIKQLIPKENGDESDDDDDDLEVGGTTQDYKCPLSLRPLEDPVTSSICGHSFSAETIRSFFKGTELKRCPASGCVKSFRLSDCRPDKELAKKVKAWLRRNRRANENSDAEEVVE
ncbi:hypothetical protein AMATHDRAFT_72968 [Amanita thiersii Skay4041]|uniref:SP-RING-type domain-containing protein n=1 Tax=Amanita thiersii Skay4041 TaxID=703135 RepID=A0A2A9P0B1_9AGAR|nr:hypothetical protein AMATHDRAFT_72968 [Amanita thiersii Skay4041]